MTWVGTLVTIITRYGQTSPCCEATLTNNSTDMQCASGLQIGDYPYLLCTCIYSYDQVQSSTSTQ